MHNTSILHDNLTARTNTESAAQRAEHMYILGVKKVLELCVGPSLRTLEQEYAKYGIKCVGNDIEPRWQKYYPSGEWLIGDCFSVDTTRFDAIVFAPPLSKGCTGKREDSLSIQNVFPSYNSFIERNFPVPLKCMVLPGRSLATKEDRKQFYKLVSSIPRYELIPLTKNNVVKYYDMYIK